MAVIRRIVTARAPDGKSIFACDEIARAIDVGIPLHPIWGWDEAPALPFADPGTFPAQSVFPPTGGVRVSVGIFPPGMGKAQAGETTADADALDTLLTTDGSSDAAPPNPGLHATDTADVCVVISGEVWLELDDGVERRIGPGDIVFQMGTVHTWHNRTSEPCVMAMLVFGLKQAG